MEIGEVLAALQQHMLAVQSVQASRNHRNGALDVHDEGRNLEIDPIACQTMGQFGQSQCI